MNENGFDWEFHPELYLYGSIKEIWKRDPIGSRFIREFAMDYQEKVKYYCYFYGDADLVRQFFLQDYPRYTRKYFGVRDDIKRGVKTERIKSRIVRDNQFGESSYIAPTTKFYDMCVEPVLSRFANVKSTEFVFVNPEVKHVR